jgi:uncharacterized protein YndB with AHSA1/START domain
MSDYGDVTEAGTVRFRRVLPGPVERVWAFLTEPEKRATWFGGGPMELRAGGAARMHIRHANLSPGETPPEKYRKANEGIEFDYCILAAEPPRLLAFTWPGEEGTPDSEVTITLTEQGRPRAARTDASAPGPPWHDRRVGRLAHPSGPAAGKAGRNGGAGLLGRASHATNPNIRSESPETQKAPAVSRRSLHIAWPRHGPRNPGDLPVSDRQ